MGLVSRMVRRVAQSVAEQIASRARMAELFEKPGERAPSGPPVLPLGDLNGDDDFDAPEPATVEIERTAPVNGLDAQPAVLEAGIVRVVDFDQLRATLASDPRPKVVHHWATWCDSCVEELPEVDALVKRLGQSALVVGVSWELFERFGKDEFAVVRDLTRFAQEQALAMPTLVYRGEPDRLFEALPLDFQQIPQTRVFDAAGAELHAFKGPMAGDDFDTVAELVGATD